MCLITIVWNRNMCTLWNNKNSGKSRRQTILEHVRSKCFRLYLSIQSESTVAQLRGFYRGLLITWATGNCQKNNSLFTLLLHGGLSDSSTIFFPQINKQINKRFQQILPSLCFPMQSVWFWYNHFQNRNTYHITGVLCRHMTLHSQKNILYT